MTEDPDSLRSSQTAEIVDLWCEGEIQGLVNGLRSVYLDGVPLENADGSKNFENVQFDWRPGTQGQTAMPGFDVVQNEVAVGIAVPQATPVVRTISDAEVDHVRVTISVPQLTHQDTTTGDLKGSQFEYVIEVQSAGGGYVERVRDTVKGKRTSGYKRSKKVQLAGSAPWDIRVRRITADAATSATQNAFAWETYTEIKSLRLRYPNSAMSGLRVSAAQFARIPGRAFDILAMRVQVPSNYDPLSRVYTGTWDGSFVVAWTDDPAWIFREMATHPRWGLGRFVDQALVNKWWLYRISQYCAGMVPDGYGGQEPRFTCNLYLQTREQAIKVLQDLAAIFRGIVYWAGGQLQAVQDAPSDPTMLFTPANVVDGLFVYQGTSEVTRHSVFIVHYNDLSQLGKRAPEVYAPPELVARYGLRELELSPLGVTSRGQAQRLARWAAYSEEREGETVSFRVGAEGAYVLPGRVFQIADPTEAGERLGGRVVNASPDVVLLDAEVTLASGEDYTLKVQLADPDDPAAYLTEERPVVDLPGTTSVLTVYPPFTAAPKAEATWVLQSTEVAATSWRCLAVAEVDGEVDQFEVVGVAHDPSKYDAIELGYALEPRQISRVRVVPAAPVGPVVFTETPYLVGSTYRSRLAISWGEPAAGLLYAVAWRLNSGPWTDLPLTSANCVEIDGLAKGALEVTVRAQNALGNGSVALEGSTTVNGKTEPAGDVIGLEAEVVQGGVLFTWSAPAADAYLKTTLVANDVALLFEGAATSWLWPWPPLGTYTVTARHWDTALNESAEASVSVTVDESVQLQWASVRGRPKLFRAVAKGFSDTHAPSAPGLFDAETGASVSGIVTDRSYNLAVLRRSDGVVLFARQYDVYGLGGSGGFTAADLAADLNAQGAGVIVVVWSHDEPRQNRLTGGLEEAMYRCGASRAVFGSPLFRTRSAYILVGIAGCGEGNGFEAYNGQVDSSTDAWCDAAFFLQNGQLVISGTSTPPRSLADYGYVGTLDATTDLSLVATGYCVLKGNNAVKAAGAPGWGDAQVYSRDGYAGGAAAMAVAADVTSDVMFGLNVDPAADASWASLDHAIYLSGISGAVVQVYESGALVNTSGNYVTGDTFQVTFDGYTVRYLRNGVVFYTSLVHPAAGTTFYFDSAFYTVGGALDRLRFTPMSGVRNIQSDQVAPGAISDPNNASLASLYLYAGTAVAFTGPFVVNGPGSITTRAGSRVFGFATGHLLLNINTGAARWTSVGFKLQLVRSSDGVVMDESGTLQATDAALPVGGVGVAYVQAPCNVSLVFEAVPAGTYQIRFVVTGVSCYDSSGSAANLTHVAYFGEISSLDLKA